MESFSKKKNTLLCGCELCFQLYKQESILHNIAIIAVRWFFVMGLMKEQHKEIQLVSKYMQHHRLWLILILVDISSHLKYPIKTRKIKEFEHWWAELCRLGPKFCCYAEASKWALKWNKNWIEHHLSRQMGESTKVLC